MTRKLILLTLILLLYQKVSAQDYKFQALFIYNIVQRIEWPSIEKEFVIGVIGSKEMEKELSSIAQTKTMNGHKIRIKQLTPYEFQTKDVHLVYLARPQSTKIAQITNTIKDKPILLVSDKKGLHGGHINFLDLPGKIEFEIYPSLIKSHNLKVANSLLNLGIVKK